MYRRIIHSLPVHIQLIHGHTASQWNSRKQNPRNLVLSPLFKPPHPMGQHFKSGFQFWLLNFWEPNLRNHEPYFPKGLNLHNCSWIQRERQRFGPTSENQTQAVLSGITKNGSTQTLRSHFKMYPLPTFHCSWNLRKANVKCYYSDWVVFYSHVAQIQVTAWVVRKRWIRLTASLGRS